MNLNEVNLIFGNTGGCYSYALYSTLNADDRIHEEMTIIRICRDQRQTHWKCKSLHTFNIIFPRVPRISTTLRKMYPYPL